jgi:hypothetical protein
VFATIATIATKTQYLCAACEKQQHSSRPACRNTPSLHARLHVKEEEHSSRKAACILSLYDTDKDFKLLLDILLAHDNTIRSCSSDACACRCMVTTVPLAQPKLLLLPPTLLLPAALL